MNSCTFVLLIVSVGVFHVTEAGNMKMIYHCLDYINKVAGPFREKQANDGLAICGEIEGTEQIDCIAEIWEETAKENGLQASDECENQVMHLMNRA